MGFCFFNSVCLGAQHAIAKHGLERVLIVDWDVHHGNGTQNLFFERSDVLFISCHRGYGFYPGSGALEETGEGAGKGYTVNLPLEPGTGDSVFTDLFRRIIVPIGKEYAPQLILVSAGFDAHTLDPLGGLAVTGPAFGTACELLKQLAEEVSDGQIALILEGGYDLVGLVDGVDHCVTSLAQGMPLHPPDPRPEVERLRRFHATKWPCLEG